MARRSRLDPNRSLKTRSDHDVRIYEIFYERYINFAYYDRDTDIWWPRQANWDGTDVFNEKALDLVNVKE